MQGCHDKESETMKLGDWIQMMHTEAGLQGYQQQKPYYLNIPSNSMYFPAIQSAVEWGILDTAYSFDPEATLTREWAAYTLLNLAGFSLNNENGDIKDLRKSMFPKHISTATSIGMMNLNTAHCFQPEQVMDKEEAVKLLHNMITYMNTKEFDNQVIEFELEDVDLVEVEPIEEDKEQNTITLSQGQDIQPEQYIHYMDSNQQEQYAQIHTIEENDNAIIAHLKEPEVEEFIKTIDFQDSFEIDFTNAEIIDLLDPNSITSSSLTFPTNIRNVSYKLLQKEHDINGFHISYRATASGFFAEVTKATKHGGKLYTSFSLNGVQPHVKWKMKEGKIEEGYFRVDFNTTEKLGMDTSYESIKFGDLSSFNINNLKSSLSSLFKDKQDIENVVVPICEVKVPIPNMPIATISMQLQLKIYASGKAELVLAQTESIGMEIRNGSMRTIQNITNDAKSIIKASASIVSSLVFGLKLGDYMLSDVAIDGGAKAKLDSELHLFDENQNHQIMKVDMPIDLVEKATEGNGDILSCANVNAYWVLDALINSSSSLAGKYGFSKTLHILDESNSSLIPGLKSHMENGMFVAHCTRKDREFRKQEKEEVNTDLIDLKNYHLILKEGETKKIAIQQLPKEYKMKDIVYFVEDSRVASVTQNGEVSGIEEGSTVIYMRTNDHKYEIKCTVIVTKV